MKLKEIEKLRRARSIINLMQEGIDPVSHQPVSADSFLHDPKIIRILSYISLVLSQDIQESVEDSKLLKNNMSNAINTDATSNKVNYNNVNLAGKINRFKSTEELRKLAEYMSRNELPKG